MKRGNKPKVAGFITDWLRPDGSASYGAVGWYRVINPLEKLSYKWYGKTILGGDPETAMMNSVLMGKKGNIWLHKPVDNPGIHVFLDTAKHFTESQLILDLDDEPFEHNKAHPLYDKLKEKEPLMRKMIALSDHIIVSTEPLKESLKQYGKKITVIPNSIDPAIWEVKKKERNDGKIRIGWMGSGSHLADTHIINEAFDEILKKYPHVEIHMAGFVDNDSERNDREFHHRPTMGYKEYPQFLADMDLDIAVAPLMDSKFNRSKSNIKWLEHSMLETPMVLSDVTPYKECVKNYKTGYLAANKSQWVKYLSWLVENKEKREEIGKAAKAVVLEKYTIDLQLPKYEKLFDRLMKKKIAVYTALVGGIDDLNEGQKTEGANFIAFSDHASETWDVRKPYDKFTDNRRNSRIQKIMPHLFLDCEYSIYLDANIELLVPPQQLIDQFLKDKDIAVFKHAGRDDIYQEREAILFYKKEEPEILFEQTSAYVHMGIKDHSGLSECGVIIRRHTPRINDLNEKWWAHYCRYGVRDQMSFPVVFPLEEVHQITPCGAWNHPYFKMINHKA